MFRFLRSRSEALEIMDNPDLSATDLLPVLQELDTINNLLGGYRASRKAFAHIGISEGATIADFGCGAADVIQHIDKWCHRQNLPVHFVGIDFSPEIILQAKKQKLHYSAEYMCEDVLSDAIAAKSFDIVHSCLFTHHFNNTQWPILISRMVRSAKYAVVINDLHRHWLAYYSIGILTKLFSKSYMVKNDAPLSVHRGFTRKELHQLLDKAGIKNYRIRWYWAFRWQVIIWC